MQRWIACLAAITVCVSALAPASAQTMVKNVEPYIAAVTTDKAPMRGSDASFYYPVRELKSGELLRVTGEGPGWVRVEYPQGMRAYVHASDVEAAKDGKSVKLIRQSQLLAYDITPNAKAPWWPLDIERALPAGTSMDVVSVQQGPDGVVQGYVVPAPPRARGYVAKDHVRRATPEEAAKFTGPAEPAATPATPTPATPDPTTPPSGAGSGAVPPGFTPVEPAAATPPPATPTGETPTAPAAETPTEFPQPRPAPPAPKKDEDIEQLRAMFNNVMTSKDDAEVPALLNLFNSKIAKLGDSEADNALRTQLQQRVEVLKLRQDIAAALQKAREAEAAQDSRVVQVRLIVEQAEKQAIYTIVGRIVPSTVYDGKRGLPLMYRVESADALSPRTVGYILPREGLDLITKLGQVCGIVGDTRFDPSLGLNIVSPRRVDVLGVSGTATPGATPATPPPAPPSTFETQPVPIEPEK